MALDPRLIDLGFTLEGSTLKGGDIHNCTIIPSEEGCTIVTPNGERIHVPGVTHAHVESLTMSGSGKVGIIL